MATELEYQKEDVINAVRQNARVLHTIVIFIVAILVLLSSKYLSPYLDYIPAQSVIILMSVVMALVFGVVLLVKKISGTAMNKLSEYSEKIDELFVAKQQEIAERKIAQKKLTAAYDDLETKVEERTVELSDTVGALEKEVAERRHAEEMIQMQITRLNVVHSIETTINASLDLNFTLDHLINQVTAQLGIDAATILLLNQEIILEYVVSKGFRSKALNHTRLKLGEGYAGMAAKERRVVTITDLSKESNSFEKSELFENEKFRSYFGVPLIAKGQLLGVIELFHRESMEPDAEWLDFIKTIATQAANAIDNALLFDRLRQSNLNLALAYDTTIEGWSKAMDIRDKETEGHSRRVTEMTINVAQELKIADKELAHFRRGALLHDIGKLGIPDSILLKPGKLTDEEWVIMKKHPEYARNLLYPIEHLRPAIDIPYYHHERWDGTGYPEGLRGEQIPLAARIFAIVDVWDALRSDRPYRPAWSKDKVMEHISAGGGTHFDPKVLEAFLKTFEKLNIS